MNQEICRSCGGILTREGNYYVCKFCGNKWTIDAADDVHVVDRANAWSALRDCDFERSVELFENIIYKEPDNHESYWGRALASSGIIYVTDLNESKKVPTFNKISERSFIESRDVQKAISLAPSDIADTYMAQARQIEGIRTEWLEKAKKEPKYDVFICFKDSDRERGIDRTDDSYSAQELYTALMEAGYKVFFSRVSLRGKIAEHYEPYIYNAIKTAKVMIVYGERPEYFNAVWLKNEWTRFRARIENGEKEQNSLVVAYKGFDPADLPAGLRSRQCLNADSLTFLEDLKKHIEKIIKKNVIEDSPELQRPREPVQPVKRDEPLKPLKPQKPLNPNVSQGKKTSYGMIIALVLAGLLFVGGISSIFNFGELLSCSQTNREEYSEGIVFNLNLYASNTYLVEKGSFDGKHLIIPNYTPEGKRVVGIETFGFQNSYNMTDATIPDNIEYILQGAFMGCSSLQNVWLSGNIIKIQREAFADCGSLTAIHFNGTISQWQSIEKEPFWDQNTGGYTVFCSDGTVGKVYPETGSNATDYPVETEGETTETEDEFMVGDFIFYAHGDGTCTLGEMYGGGDTAVVPKISPAGDIVTGIGTGAFQNWSSLTSITLPDSITHIDSYAFEGCSGITNINIPEGVTGIGEAAFLGCKSLESITIPDNVTLIDTDAFKNCSSLVSVFLGNRVSEIGYGMFEGCSSLTDITIPDSVTSLGYGAFIGCSSLKSIIIPDSVTFIGSSVFYGCEGLESITLPFVGREKDGTRFTNLGAIFGANNGYTENSGYVPVSLKNVVITGGTSIDDWAFYACGNIESITIPESIKSIGENVFTNCNRLETIKYLGTVEEWNAIIKGAGWDSNTGNYTVVCSDGTIEDYDIDYPRAPEDAE